MARPRPQFAPPARHAAAAALVAAVLARHQARCSPPAALYRLVAALVKGRAEGRRRAAPLDKNDKRR